MPVLSLWNGQNKFLFHITYSHEKWFSIRYLPTEKFVRAAEREGITSEVWQISGILFKEKAILAFDQIDHMLWPTYLGIEM